MIGTMYPCGLAMEILFYSQRLSQHYPGRTPDPIFGLPTTYSAMMELTPLCSFVRIECGNNQSETTEMRR